MYPQVAVIRSFFIRTFLLLSSLLAVVNSVASDSTSANTDTSVKGQSSEEIVTSESFENVQVIEEVTGSDSPVLPIVITRGTAHPDVRIDGYVDEALWQQVSRHSHFVVTDPDTLELAHLKTVVHMFYNDDGFYLAVDMTQDKDTLVKRLSARDEGFLTRDSFIFNLDTSGEGRYGFWFQMGLGDGKSDGTVQPERQFSSDWDGAWYGATKVTDTGWSAEFYIPWSIMAMPRVDGQRQMGIYMSRKIAAIDQRHGWPGLAYSQPKFLSAFQPLVFDEVNPKRQLVFFPYVSSQYDSLSTESDHRLGSDLFWRPSTNFQMTATMQPDFGTVESDTVIVNLTAIETFYPEKRLFFLEGQDIFRTTERSNGFSSNSRVSLLHTRRIGARPIFPEIPTGAQFEWEDFSRNAELLGAAKTTGTAGNLSYGVLMASEEDSRFHGTLDGEPVSVTQSGRDFSVVRGLWESNGQGYRGIGVLSTKMSHHTGDVHTHGIDSHYFSSNGKLKIDSQVVMSDVPETQNGYGGLIDVEYVPSRGVSHEVSLEEFDDHVNLNHMGYLGRNDFRMFKYRFRHRQTNVGAFLQRDTRVSMDTGWNGASEPIQRSIDFTHELTFQNFTEIRFSGEYEPRQYDDRNSFGNGSFQLGAIRDFQVRYRSDRSKRFYYYVSGSWQDETTTGARRSSNVSMVLRPSDRFSMWMNLSYTDRDAWLLNRGDRQFATFASESWGPSVAVNYFISADQYIRFDLQWIGIRASESDRYQLPDDNRVLQPVARSNSTEKDAFAISRMNVQLRYRWELAPMSDLFVVYTKAADLPDALGKSFLDQFTDTFGYATSEGLIVKLRHRIGA